MPRRLAGWRRLALSRQARPAPCSEGPPLIAPPAIFCGIEKSPCPVGRAGLGWGIQETFRGRIPVFRTKSIRIAASRFRLPDKEKPRSSEATRLRGLFEPQGSAGLEVGTKGRRSLLRCRHSKCHTESSDCRLDSRLIAVFLYAPRGYFCPLCRVSDQGQSHGVSGWVQHGGSQGRREYGFSPDRPSAVFCLGRMGHWNGDRDCEPTQLTVVARMGETGRNSSACRAQKPRHGRSMAGFCYDRTNYRRRRSLWSRELYCA